MIKRLIALIVLLYMFCTPMQTIYFDGANDVFRIPEKDYYMIEQWKTNGVKMVYIDTCKNWFTREIYYKVKLK